MSGTAIGKEFEATDFIENTFACGTAELAAEMVGDDERAGGGFESRLGFEDANGFAAASKG